MIDQPCRVRRVRRPELPLKAVRLFGASLTWLVMLALLPTVGRAAFTITYQANTDPTTQGFVSATTGAASTAIPLANDLGLPAWSITGSALDSSFGYNVSPFSASQLSDLTNYGATLEFTGRAIQQLAPTWTTDDPVGIIAVSLGTGALRFDFGLAIDANGDTVVGLVNSFAPLVPAVRPRLQGRIMF